MVKEWNTDEAFTARRHATKVYQNMGLHQNYDKQMTKYLQAEQKVAYKLKKKEDLKNEGIYKPILKNFKAKERLPVAFEYMTPGMRKKQEHANQEIQEIQEDLINEQEIRPSSQRPQHGEWRKKKLETIIEEEKQFYKERPNLKGKKMFTENYKQLVKDLKEVKRKNALEKEERQNKQKERQVLLERRKFWEDFEADWERRVDQENAEEAKKEEQIANKLIEDQPIEIPVQIPEPKPLSKKEQQKRDKKSRTYNEVMAKALSRPQETKPPMSDFMKKLLA